MFCFAKEIMARLLILVCVGLFATVLAKEAQIRDLDEYLKMMKMYSTSIGKIGNIQNGELELIDDPEKIAVALEKTKRDIGIIYQDKYWIWINDPVLFPNGKMGVYGRILSRSSLDGYAGCAVVPLFTDGKIALNCNFRHATRSWELEIPRGFKEANESPIDAAKREVLEETGFVIDNIIYLGEMPPDTGKSNAVAAIYVAIIDGRKKANPEESEAIESILAFSIDEIKEGLKNGSILINIRGEEKKVFVRDPFLTFALVQMDIRGLLKPGAISLLLDSPTWKK